MQPPRPWLSEEQASHGLGFVPERIHRRAAARVGSAVRRRIGSTAEKGGVPRDPIILDQGRSNSCTGHFGAEAIYGMTGTLTSPWMIWTYGRLRAGQRLGRLTNDGVRLSAMERGLLKHGSCLFEDWNPETPGFARDALPPALKRPPGQRYNVRTRSVYGTGNFIVDAMCANLEEGCPVGVVVNCDDSFMRAKSDPVGPEDGSPSRGLHIITGWSFYRASGGIVIECVNSWGTGHGDGGIVRLTGMRAAQYGYGCLVQEVS